MFIRHGKLIIPALAAMAAATAALAQVAANPETKKACSDFSWSVARERDWFSDANLPRRASGARLRRIDRAVSLDLEPTKDVRLFLPPARKPRAKSFSGEVTFFGVPRAGRYQVTLSDDASIDVFENGARLRPTSVTSDNACEVVSKSERFALAPGDLVLVEVTDARERSIKVAFSEAP